jgi:hypothetical protein
MSAHRKPKRLPPPDADIAIYCGRELIGTVERRRGKFRAINLEGKRLGTFSAQADAYGMLTGHQAPRAISFTWSRLDGPA